MKYTQKSFNGPATSEAYRDNFDRIFRQCTSEFEFRGHVYRCKHDRAPKHDAHEALLVDGDKPPITVSWSSDGKESFVYETLIVK